MISRTAAFGFRADDVPAAEAAIVEFVGYIDRHERGSTLLYATLRSGTDPAAFLHIMVFADEAAQERHRSSEGILRFTAVLYPLTVDGVQFADFELVATTPLG